MTQQPDETTPDDVVPDDVVPDDVVPDDAEAAPGGTRPGAPSGGTDTPGVGSPEKDPADWVTGDEPPTGPQASYLGTLAREAGVDVPDDLTKAQASEMIDDLQSRTGRGQ